MKVPLEFKPIINTIYPYENLRIFEEWCIDKFTEQFDREYLPIQWTAYHVNNNYGNDVQCKKRLQDFINSLPKNKKYFTIVQYDDGVLVDVSGIDLLQFSMSKKLGVEIPLLCMPHSYKWDGKTKNYFASFIGKKTHPIREHVFGISNSEFYVSEQNHSCLEFCKILAGSLFGLAPRGYGLNSFRLSECMQYKTIPVYISDEFINVFDANFEDYGVLIHEKDAHRIEQILYAIPHIEILKKQNNIEKYYQEYYTYEGALNKIKKYLKDENSYNT